MNWFTKQKTILKKVVCLTVIYEFVYFWGFALWRGHVALDVLNELRLVRMMDIFAMMLVMYLMLPHNHHVYLSCCCCLRNCSKGKNNIDDEGEDV